MPWFVVRSFNNGKNAVTLHFPSPGRVDTRISKLIEVNVLRYAPGGRGLPAREYAGRNQIALSAAGR